MNEESTPRYQQSAAESYVAPTVITPAEMKKLALKRRENTIGAVLHTQTQNFFLEKGFAMSGKQQRQLRRKLERLYDAGKLKLANLNE
jgi:hypothetical protein